MPKPTEWDLQRAFVIWFEGELWEKGPHAGTWKVMPAKLPGVVMWHTPNGGVRSAVEGKRFKLIGVKAGVHDLLFLWGGLYGIELKEPGGTGKLQPSQEAMHPAMLAAGMVASAVADNLEACKAFARRHGLVQPGK